MYAQAVRKPPVPRRGWANNQVRLNMFKGCAFSDVGLDCIKYLKLGDPPYNTHSAFEHYDDSVEHSTWLSLMYPRLELLRDFLAEDGSIWISIDDREYASLKLICDEIFGLDCFVSNISWQRTYSTRNDSKGIVNEVEHILVYSGRPDWRPNKLPRTVEMDKKYKNPDNDKISWKSADASAPLARGDGHGIRRR